jgi:tRNA nucleotidyltransferase (CCA-adding enzyme)
LVARHHLLCHRLFELRPSTVLELLESLDAFRRPERVGLFAVACEADARGRAGFEDNPYPQRTQLLCALDAARAVDAGAIAAQTTESGSGGDAIGTRIRERRIQAVRKAMAADVRGV